MAFLIWSSIGEFNNCGSGDTVVLFNENNLECKWICAIQAHVFLGSTCIHIYIYLYNICIQTHIWKRERKGDFPIGTWLFHSIYSDLLQLLLLLETKVCIFKNKSVHVIRIFQWFPNIFKKMTNVLQVFCIVCSLPSFLLLSELLLPVMPLKATHAFFTSKMPGMAICSIFQLTSHFILVL